MHGQGFHGHGGEREAGRRSRFPFQPVLYHEAGYRLTQEDRLRARRGQAFFFRGSALAKVEYVAKRCGSQEAMWFLAGRDGEPIVEDILVPRQRCSSVSTEVAPADVLRTARALRQRGYVALGAGHSHGEGSCFVSRTDEGEAETLLREAVGQTSVRTETSTEEVCPVTLPDGATALRASFADGALDVEIALPGPLPAGAPARVTLSLHRRLQVSTFTTSNAWGEHLVPALAGVRCPACGASQNQAIPTASITVHVIGAVALSPAERGELDAIIEENVSTAYSLHTTGGSSYGTAYATTTSGASVALPAASAGEGAPAPYTLEREGMFVAKIDAALLEEAAAKVPGLARCLGWEVDPREEKRNAGGRRAAGSTGQCLS